MKWGGRTHQGQPVDTYGLAQKAEILKHEQDYLSGLDTLVKCDFGSFGITPQSYARMFSAATGRAVTADFFDRLGERIWNQIRLFNLREGLTASEDRLPARITNDPLPGGPHKGQRIRPEDMAAMLNDYYRLRGWDARGQPEKQTLERIGLNTKRKLTL